MDFASLTLFLILYYIRPQEWIAAIQPLKPVTLIMAFAIISILMRPRGFTLKELFKTPHDWMMLFYCLWIVIAAPDKMDTFKSVYTLYLFYAVTVLALSNLDRVRRFMTWWAVMIFVLAGLAVLSEYGFDPTYSYDITHGIMQHRLVFNTSLYNNPNALGHSIVPVLVMLYFLFIWKRPIFVRIGAIPLFVVPVYCIYLTVSKGAFVSGFATLVAALSFGRPKVVQILILVGAMTVGWGALKSLPRMQEIQKSRTDDAIQGRISAFKFGLHKLKTDFTGVGKDRFVPTMFRETKIYKAAHSSYVQIGCELGKVGLFLFLGNLYCALRTLVSAKTRNTDEERVRRILFSMIISYMVSSWMVDFAYRANYFMFCGAIAAFHRMMMSGKTLSETAEDNQTVQEAIGSLAAAPIGGLRPAAAGMAPAVINQATISQAAITVPALPGPLSKGEPYAEENPGPGITWMKYRWVDFALNYLLFYAVIRFWDYILRNM